MTPRFPALLTCRLRQPGRLRRSARTSASKGELPTSRYNMTIDFKQMEPRFKEILYRCLEEIKATRAALYLLNGDNLFSLVSQYGFGEVLRKQVNRNDAIVDRLIMRRAAFFVNGVMSEPRFSEHLFHAQTDRMLVAPISVNGRLVGFVDMRDKSGKQPFDANDLESGKKISDMLVSMFGQNNLYGQAAVPANTTSSTNVEEPLARIIEQAQILVARNLTGVRSLGYTLSETEIASITVALPSMLMIPGVAMVAFSAFGHLGGIQAIVARSPVTDEAMSQFEAKVQAWLRKRGEPDQPTRKTVTHPYGTGGPPIFAGSIVSVLSAPVKVAGISGLVLSVAFENSPNPQARSLLEQSLGQLEHTVQFVISHKNMQIRNQRIAEKLLEPDFQKYPELVDHSKRTSDLSDQLAHHIGLSSGEIETVRISALVHDVGLRLLDYRRLYRKPDITTDEAKILRDHPVVGAAITEPLLGAEIANIVLSHHERPDGKGYPAGLVGEQIPMAARIIHVCDAFLSMTSTNSYQPPVTEAQAMERIRRAAGVEFDKGLSAKLAEMLS